MKSIGLCAHFSRQGDWAFQFAFNLARRNDLQLNVFHWLDSPYRYHRDLVYKDASHKELVSVTPELMLEKERELREYYDDFLGDYESVGFRLCEGTEETELARCLSKGQYDVLVIGYQEPGILFGRDPIETFAQRFRVPVVLVGPNRRDQFFLNTKAVAIVKELGIPDGKWQELPPLGHHAQAANAR